MECRRNKTTSIFVDRLSKCPAIGHLINAKYWLYNLYRTHQPISQNGFVSMFIINKHTNKRSAQCVLHHYVSVPYYLLCLLLQFHSAEAMAFVLFSFIQLLKRLCNTFLAVYFKVCWTDVNMNVVWQWRTWLALFVFVCIRLIFMYHQFYAYQLPNTNDNKYSECVVYCRRITYLAI